MSGKVLITRPTLSAQKTAEAIAAIGFECVIAPVIDITPVDFDLPNSDEIDGFVFTSVNGVQSFCAKSAYRDKPVYCVGDTTALAARDCGFHDVHTAKGTAQDLAQMIHDKTQVQRVYVHFRGRDVAHSIGELLADSPKCTVIETIVYEARVLESISPKALKELENKTIEYALFYSTRTAKAFTNLVIKAECPSLMKPIKALCLGHSMVEFVAKLPWKDIIVSDTPNEAALLSLLNKDKINRSNYGQE